MKYVSMLSLKNKYIDKNKKKYYIDILYLYKSLLFLYTLFLSYNNLRNISTNSYRMINSDEVCKKHANFKIQALKT